VRGHDGQVVTLQTSVESKGIVGNDGRHYLLDLLRTFPPDVHFLPGARFCCRTPTHLSPASPPQTPR